MLLSLKKKMFFRFLAIVLVALLWVNPLVAPLVWAEEASSQEVTQTSESNPTPAPESTITAVDPPTSPTPTLQSAIATGDANASSEAKTTVNTHQDTIPGEINTAKGNCTPPEGETSCPNDISLKNNDSAEVSDSTSSQAGTGENATTGFSGNTSIITGDATASGTIGNEVNSNTVILEPAPPASPIPSPESIMSLSFEPKTLNVENNNEGTVTNKADITASTGQNLASENLGDVKIDTGDALALANLLNLLNTNIVGSNFQVLILDALDSKNDINLNELWKQILKTDSGNSLALAEGATLSHLQILVQNKNQANLKNDVNVFACTGENQADKNNNASIQTGDATALANITNIVNTNILGSQFLFGVINILGSFEGNLILPRPENFLPPNSSQNHEGGAIFKNQNQAEIQDEVSVSAETGQNKETNNSGDNLIKTGDARAVANAFSLVNLNIFYNNWFFLNINHLGSWTGKLSGWLSPSAQEDPQQGSQVLELGLDKPSSEAEQSVAHSEFQPSLTFENQNQAVVSNNIKTQASTGGNQAEDNRGNTSIETGKASSLANVFNLVNLNILGGHFFMGLVNILGNWSGNAIFAYPDVTLSLNNGSEEVSPGKTFEYALSFKNQGQDDAQNVEIDLELPTGLIFVGDSSGMTPTCSAQRCVWKIGDLRKGEGGSFWIQVRLEPNFSANQTSSLLEMFIPRAYAAENKTSIIVNASIKTVDPESDMDNNSAEAVTTVSFPPGEERQDPRQPVLEISAWNNVNGFVYLGDTVTFEITIKNTSDVPSYNTKLIQRLYNGVPEDFGTAEFDLGTIGPGKTGKLSFGLKLVDGGSLSAGAYRTIAQAFGEAPNGREVSSNEAKTFFTIKRKENSFHLAAQAKEDEKILGDSAVNCPKPVEKEDIFPYVLLLLLSSAYLTNWAKPKLKRII